MRLTNLVNLAYGIELYRLAAPQSMNSMAMFDLNAKLPPNTTRQQFQTMLQNLLADRFKLAVHRENIEVNRFDLIVAKGGPRFKEAPASPPPDAPADTRPGPPPVDRNGFPIFPPGRPGMAMMNDKARLYQPRMTMQTLASQVSAQLRSPVIDATNLKGQYEINIYWVPDQGLRAAQPESDPGPTLIEALKDQLGLALEKRKGSVEFLVVDHAENFPTDN